jgi:phosphatidylglycerophosphate synthase
MAWSELRRKCKRQSDYIITLFITNEISLFFTWILINTKITPNQVTLASIFCSALCGACYAYGHFFTGSAFLFLSHILDCTDGNLARAKLLFSPLGKWMDMVGDRLGEIILFIGVSFYFVRNSDSFYWVTLPIIDSLFLLLYYYIVDMGLAQDFSKPLQKITNLQFKDVYIKWGTLEPVIYGFVLLAPMGLIKVQLVMVLIMSLAGLIYQIFKRLNFKERSTNI